MGTLTELDEYFKKLKRMRKTKNTNVAALIKIELDKYIQKSTVK